MPRKWLINLRLAGIFALIIVSSCAGVVCAQELLPPGNEGHHAPPEDAHWRFSDHQPCAECEGDCWHGQQGAGCGQEGFLGSTFAHLLEMSSRSTETHGRSVGMGRPLRGTSWLNRPYEVAVDTGSFVMTSNPTTGVRRANDVFLALQAGVDWDNYWGTQARVGWSTPDLNSSTTGTGESDNIFLTDVSLMYYPWGDSRVRPYWRMGMGLTDIEFTNINGVRQQEFLFTIPFGIGIKHQTRRWLTWRAEVLDNLAFGMNEVRTMNNLTFTFGVEARFGGRPSGYWAWRPRGYAW